jgi:nicotinamide-nucleotide amidase
MQDTLTARVELLAQRLMVADLRVATAESCTGGGIAQALTSVAGSSDWFEYGIVSYSNASKQKLLGVSLAALETAGAVSEAVVKDMAEGAIVHSNAQLAVSVSGIAGPDGGTPDKPVGCVWLAWAMAGQPTAASCFYFQGSRDAIRAQAVEAAIDGLLSLVDYA